MAVPGRACLADALGAAGVTSRLAEMAAGASRPEHRPGGSSPRSG